MSETPQDKRYSNMKEALLDSIDLIQPDYQDEFLRFCFTGKASQEFIDYLNKDKQAQTAAERVFSVKAKPLEDLAESLAKLREERREND